MRKQSKIKRRDVTRFANAWKKAANVGNHHHHRFHHSRSINTRTFQPPNTKQNTVSKKLSSFKKKKVKRLILAAAQEVHDLQRKRDREFVQAVKRRQKEKNESNYKKLPFFFYDSFHGNSNETKSGGNNEAEAANKTIALSIAEKDKSPTLINENNNLINKYLTEAEKNDRIEQASILLFDALNFITVDHRLKEKKYRNLHLFLHGNILFTKFIKPFFVLLNLAIVLFEYPVTYQFSSQFKIIGLVELFCLLFHLFHVGGRWWLKVNRWSLVDIKVEVILSFCIMCMLVDLAIYFINFNEHMGKYSRWIRCLRFVIIIDCSTQLKEMFLLMAAAMHGLVEVFTIFTMAIFFFVIGAIFLYPPDTAEGQEVFKSLHASIMQLIFLVIGSVNFPDVMLPAVIESGKQNQIFFALFLISSGVSTFLNNNLPGANLDV